MSDETKCGCREARQFVNGARDIIGALHTSDEAAMLCLEGAENLLEQAALSLSKLAAAEQRFTAPIVCMCGSTKFKQSWIAENARLTDEGNIVLAVGLWGHHERKYPSAERKAMLDALHKRKIDLCDWVWVLDVGGYIGDSTRSEIDYAAKLRRPIRYLSREFPNYQEPIDPVLERAERAEAELTHYRKASMDVLRSERGMRSNSEAELQAARKDTARRCLEICREVGDKESMGAYRAFREIWREFNLADAAALAGKPEGED